MKSLSTRQSVIILSFVMLCTKIQRFPALLAQNFGQSGWIFLLLSFVFDIPFVLITLRISVLTKGKTIYQALSQKCGKAAGILYAFFGALLLVVKMGTPYKGTHEFFVSAIFDNLNWNWFSIIFVMLIVLVAAGELNRIGRTAEILFLFAVVGFVGMITLGTSTAVFERLLPLEFFGPLKFFHGFKIFNQWISDYIILLFFVGRVKENKYKTAALSAYAITFIFSTFFVAVFYANYDKLAIMQDVGISAVTEFSLFSLPLGRIDWILVLFAMSSSVVAVCFLACAAVIGFYEATKIPKKYIAIILGVICYILDTKIFTSAAVFVDYYTNYITYYVLAINYIIMPIIWISLSITKNKKNNIFIPYRPHKNSIAELRLKQFNNLCRRTKNDTKIH